MYHAEDSTGHLTNSDVYPRATAIVEVIQRLEQRYAQRRGTAASSGGVPIANRALCPRSKHAAA